MGNLAMKVETFQPILEYGIVLSIGERFHNVMTAFGQVMSERAVSCLVQPQVGDMVLLSVDREGNSFILSVLQREPEKGKKTDIVFEGDVNLNIKDGDFSLTADRNISFATDDNMAFVSDRISVHAGRGEALIERFSFIGKIFHSQVKQIKVVANKVENIFRRFTQRLKDSFRFVDDLEEIQTGSTRYLVEDTLNMHSKNAVHMAEEIVTINAEQIHLG